MVLKFNKETFQKSDQKFELIIDLFMLALICFNLTWLIFDFSFQSQWVQTFLGWFFPESVAYYRDHIHPDFFSYELIIIGIYWLEFLGRWGYHIIKNTHHRFWFYPFIRWYDILGMLPIASFRFFRLFRLFSIMYRLQTSGIVDFKDTSLGRFVARYRDIIVEEVSDRVVVNVLENAKVEIIKGQPLFHRLTSEVLLPRNKMIGEWASSQLTEMIERNYLNQNEDFQSYLANLVQQATRSNQEVQQLQAMPIIGNRIIQQLDSAITGITYKVIHELMIDLHSDRSTKHIQDGIRGFFENLANPNTHLSQLFEEVISEAIEIIISEVKIQRWKERENEYENNI